MSTTLPFLTPEDLARVYADPRPAAIAVPRRRADEPAVEQLLSEAGVLGVRVETYE